MSNKLARRDWLQGGNFCTRDDQCGIGILHFSLRRVVLGPSTRRAGGGLPVQDVEQACEENWARNAAWRVYI